MEKVGKFCSKIKECLMTVVGIWIFEFVFVLLCLGILITIS